MEQPVHVTVVLPKEIVDLLEDRKEKPIEEIVRILATNEYGRLRREIAIFNRCTECGCEVVAYLGPSVRVKSRKWMERADAKCKVCYPNSLWKRVKRTP